MGPCVFTFIISFSHVVTAFSVKKPLYWFRHTAETLRKPTHVTSNISKQTLPEKVDRTQVVSPPGQRPQTERQRSYSASSPAQPQATRKRTSSGVFQVDDAEPPPKRIELVRSNSDSGKKIPDTLPNGRRKEVEDKTEQITAPKEQVAAQKEKIAAQKEMTAQKEKIAVLKEKMTAQKEKITAQKEKIAAQKEKMVAEKVQKEKGKIVERFDANAKSKCVNAFKESDSWD